MEVANMIFANSKQMFALERKYFCRGGKASDLFERLEHVKFAIEGLYFFYTACPKFWVYRWNFCWGGKYGRMGQGICVDFVCFLKSFFRCLIFQCPEEKKETKKWDFFPVLICLKLSKYCLAKVHIFGNCVEKILLFLFKKNTVYILILL